MKCNLRFFGQEPIEEVGPRLSLRNSHIQSARTWSLFGVHVSALGPKGILAIFENYM